MANIMIVDDSYVTRKKIKDILLEVGHNVVAEAVNGVDALKKYQENMPDLVTMDITMPDMNGIEAVMSIKSEFPKAKIIMISAVEHKMMVLSALKKGASHYIMKPFQVEQVQNIVRMVLEEPPEEDFC